MIELIRDLKQYRDVETFEEYELTSCITYEMAIRNDNVIRMLKAYDAMMVYDYDELPLLYPELYIITDGHFAVNCTARGAIHDKLKDEYYLRSGDVYLNYHFFEDRYHFHGQDASCDDRAYDTAAPCLVEGEIEYYGKCFDKFSVGSSIYAIPVEEEERLKDSSLNELKELPYSFLTRHEVHFYTKRPPLWIPPRESQVISINLNIALSFNEIEAQIKVILNELQEKGKLVHTPKEFIDQKLNIPSEHRRKNGLTPSDWADALFIFDYWKMYDEVKTDLEIIAWIQIELNEYHRNNGSVWRRYKGEAAADYLGDSTIREYRKMMIDYIDNLRYKELLAGTSS